MSFLKPSRKAPRQRSPLSDMTLRNKSPSATSSSAQAEVARSVSNMGAINVNAGRTGVDVSSRPRQSRETTLLQTSNTPSRAGTSINQANVSVRKPASTSSSVPPRPVAHSGPGASPSIKDTKPATKPEQNQVIGSLWAQALARLRERDPEVANILREELKDSAIVLDNTHQEFYDTAKRKLDERKQQHLANTLLGKTLRMKERLEKLVSVVLFAKDFVSTAVASQPYASLAWTGVLLLLPLMSNASEQNEAMLNGLDIITDFVSIYSSLEELYLKQLKSQPESFPAQSGHKAAGVSTKQNISEELSKQIVQVYYLILHYETQMICFLRKKIILRAKDGTMKTQDWTAWQGQLSQADQQTKRLAEQAHLNAEIKARNLQSSQIATLQNTLQAILQQQREGHSESEKQRWRKFLDVLASSNPGGYESNKDLAQKRLDNTCVWFLDDPRFRHWQATKDSQLLWLIAPPGCGKSVLSAHIVKELLKSMTTASNVCYYFFKDGTDNRSSENALCAVLHQIFSRSFCANSFRHASQEYDRYGDNLVREYSALWRIFEAVVRDPEMGEILLVVDALDECNEEPPKLQDSLLMLLSDKQYTQCKDLRLKILSTSRPYPYIVKRYMDVSDDSVCVRFDAEEQLCYDKIQEEVKLAVARLVLPMVSNRFPEQSDQDKIIEQLQSSDQRTYLWLHLMLGALAKNIRRFDEAEEVAEFLTRLPVTVTDAYRRILNRIAPEYRDLAVNVLKVIVVARRPLTTAELSVAFTLAKKRNSFKLFKDIKIPDVTRFEDDMKDICGSFITVHNSKVYLIHQTAREFLLQNDFTTDKVEFEWHHFRKGDAEAVVAEACMRLLLLEEAASLHQTNVYAGRDETGLPWVYHREDRGYGYHLQRMTQEFCQSPTKYLVDATIFLDYSAKFWMEHYKSSIATTGETLLPDACNLCEHNPAEKLWTNLAGAGSWGQGMCFSCGLVGAAMGDLDKVIESIVRTTRQDEITNDQWGCALLRAVAVHAHRALKQLRSLNVSQRTSSNWLTWAREMAVQSDNLDILAWLMESPHVQNIEEWATYLDLAIMYDRHGIFCALLQILPYEIYTEDEFMNVLSQIRRKAIEKGNELFFKTLLDFCESRAWFPQDDDEFDYVQPFKMDVTALGRVHYQVRSFINWRDEDGHTALTLAVEESNLELVKLFIALGVDCNISSFHTSPLQSSTYNGDLNITQLLVNAGALIHLENGRDNTALSYAAMRGHLETVRYLVAQGADLNQENGDGDTPLLLAAGGGHLETVQFLLAQGQSIEHKNLVGRPPLLEAAYRGKLEMVKYLVTNGAVVNHQDSAGNTALTIAIKGSHWDVCKYLMAKKGNVDHQDLDGNITRINTYPTTASEKGQLELRNLSLTERAQLERQDSDGNTALLNAAWHGCWDLCMYLIAQGVNFNHANHNGETALNFAMRGNRLDIVQHLVANDEHVDHSDLGGENALILASQQGHLEIIKYLIAQGANMNHQTLHGSTPLSVAAYGGHVELIRWLVEAGAFLDPKDNDGDTVLHCAALSGNMEIVQYLFDVGASAHLNERNNDGDTVLHYAALSGNMEIVQYLLGVGAANHLSVRNKANETPVDCAKRRQHHEVAQWLEKQARVQNQSQVQAQTQLQAQLQDENKTSIKGAP